MYAVELYCCLVVPTCLLRETMALVTSFIAPAMAS